MEKQVKERSWVKIKACCMETEPLKPFRGRGRSDLQVGAALRNHHVHRAFISFGSFKKILL